MSWSFGGPNRLIAVLSVHLAWIVCTYKWPVSVTICLPQLPADASSPRSMHSMVLPYTLKAIRLRRNLLSAILVQRLIAGCAWTPGDA